MIQKELRLSRAYLSKEPSQKAFSTISRLFSNAAALDSRPHRSRHTGNFKDDEQAAAYEEPLRVLGNLMITLRDHHVPGPRLLRLRTEFNYPLGSGAQFDVFGLDPLITEDIYGSGDPLLDEFSGIAIKRSRAIGSRKITTNADETFVFQCSSAHREIDALCRKPFREHRNIVKLLGWGLDLDSLESPQKDFDRIPLLILERAECNLAQFMYRPSMYCPGLSYDDMRGICLDVGYGLGALHQQGITHGDMKPENILLFRDGSGWVAKLCDFGLSTNAKESDKKEFEYYGTSGWRPPEALAPRNRMHRPDSLELCDIFAFGLVVWSVFIYGARPPLHTIDDEASGNAYEHATLDLTKHFVIPKHQHRRIILTVQGALHRDPEDRERRPWEYLDPGKYSRVGKRIKLYRDTSRKTVAISKQVHQQILKNICLPLSDILRPLSIAISSVRPSLMLPSKFWKRCQGLVISSLRKLQLNTRRNKVYSEVFHDHSYLDPSAEPGEITIFKHQADGCYFVSKLFENIVRCAELGSEIENEYMLYSLARVRSRMRLCCWQKIRKTKTTNILMLSLRNMHKLRTLAWLCRGEIGRHELEQGGRKLWDPILALITTTATFRDNAMDTLSWKIEMFSLLLEYGAPIEAENAIGESVFYSFLCMINDFEANGYNHPGFAKACSKFKLFANNNHISSRTRHYMTGELPERAADVTNFRTTALHDSVLAGNYIAVRALLGSEFACNALDSMNQTALQNALRIAQNYTQLQRNWNQNKQPEHILPIIGLLQQNTTIQLDINGMHDKDPELPLGWEKLEIAFPSDELNNPYILTAYFDSYTKSTTFVRPKFSLYEDRRFALGIKDVVLGDAQTYYLDLNQFLSPTTLDDPNDIPSLVGLVYDDRWYLDEPNRSWVEDMKTFVRLRFSSWKRPEWTIWTQRNNYQLLGMLGPEVERDE